MAPTFWRDCCFFGTGEDVTATVSGTTVNWATPAETWTCAQSGYPCMDEEGLTSLPGGDVLLVDVWDYTSTSDEYWIYDTATGDLEPARQYHGPHERHELLRARRTHR